MAIDVYLNFNGNTREAVEYYAEVFGTDAPHIMTFGEAPPDPSHPLPEEAKKLVMHARLQIAGSTVMFSDVFPGMPFTEGNNISLTLMDADEEKITGWFNKLKEGGTVSMELQKTFWSNTYGSLTDKFGIQWQLSQDNGQNG
ncbi:VOC family protein [Paenibacillus tritici]|uniref:VOC family protein n=1 Tax=Paenibacillus tritici TaxID=1873425 RepID=UPI001BAAE7E2|nr:VOC family protein [Paenibacillus tritici]QUL52773.1 VOC family protein [Paenibacillus tritici]